MFLEGWGGLWFACESTSDSTGGRAHNPLTLSVSTIVVLERGPYSCLVMMKMKMKHTHTCHSQARVRANGDKRATWVETALRSSVLSFESCYCDQVFVSSNPQFFALPKERFSTRRAGPPTTAWPQRHDEEMERWPQT